MIAQHPLFLEDETLPRAIALSDFPYWECQGDGDEPDDHIISIDDQRGIRPHQRDHEQPQTKNNIDKAGSSKNLHHRDNGKCDHEWAYDVIPCRQMSLA